MTKPITSHRRADAISLGIFFIGLGIISYLNTWWPQILLVIGASLALRQYLRNRFYDMGLSFFIFGGLFIVYFFNTSWDILMPILFTIGGIYIIFREYFVTKERIGENKVEEAAEEIEDEQQNQ